MSNMYLPIGSVVELHNGSKKLMVIGIDMTDTNTNQTYDYCGVYYPEGFYDANNVFLFNNQDIAAVVHPGYDDQERRDFLERLASIKTGGEDSNVDYEFE